MRPPVGDHHEERRRIRDLHQCVHVAGWFDAAARALRALVQGRTPRFDHHRHEDQEPD